jgi:naphthoate synthase
MAVEWRAVREFSDILFEKADGIAKIAINRPEVHNAFRPQTLDQLLEAFREAHHDPDVGVILFTGSVDARSARVATSASEVRAATSVTTGCRA